jgi:hypothetical protein
MLTLAGGWIASHQRRTIFTRFVHESVFACTKEVWHAACIFVTAATSFGTSHRLLGSVAPHDKLAGRDAEIFDSRDSKLEAARAKRLAAKSPAAEQANTHTVLMRRYHARYDAT